MKTKIAISCLVVGTLLGAGVAFAAPDSDTDRANPEAFVKDSIITTKIKTQLAAEHLNSLANVQVDTDKNGIVWLSGSARTQEAIDKAVSIATKTEGVKSVHSSLVIKKDD
jgi:hyperosmotically inducible periplasmic protein